MMSIVMNTRTPEALARACELGVAMQLTNIARDVGEDARAGRLYLPMQWLREEGIEPDAWLANPVFGPGIARVVQRLLAAADDLYARAEKGVAHLPRDCRPAIHAARLVYAEIGREVEAAGADSVNKRAVVSGRRKLALLARASTAAVVAPGLSWRRATALQPLAAICYLVDAAALPLPVERSIYGRAVRMIELLEIAAARKRDRLQYRNGMARAQPYAGAD
jgi:phytoene synthase